MDRKSKLPKKTLIALGAILVAGLTWSLLGTPGLPGGLFGRDSSAPKDFYASKTAETTTLRGAPSDWFIPKYSKEIVRNPSGSLYNFPESGDQNRFNMYLHSDIDFANLPSKIDWPQGMLDWAKLEAEKQSVIFYNSRVKVALKAGAVKAVFRKGNPFGNSVDTDNSLATETWIPNLTTLITDAQGKPITRMRDGRQSALADGGTDLLSPFVSQTFQFDYRLGECSLVGLPAEITSASQLPCGIQPQSPDMILRSWLRSLAYGVGFGGGMCMNTCPAIHQITNLPTIIYNRLDPKLWQQEPLVLRDGWYEAGENKQAGLVKMRVKQFGSIGYVKYKFEIDPAKPSARFDVYFPKLSDMLSLYLDSDKSMDAFAARVMNSYSTSFEIPPMRIGDAEFDFESKKTAGKY